VFSASLFFQTKKTMTITNYRLLDVDTLDPDSPTSLFSAATSERDNSDSATAVSAAATAATQRARIQLRSGSDPVGALDTLLGASATAHGARLPPPGQARDALSLAVADALAAVRAAEIPAALARIVGANDNNAAGAAYAAAEGTAKMDALIKHMYGFNCLFWELVRAG
jgi:hypothetical protein